ncbi:4'-phosphopantetheinyl transferase superfamily protein [Leptolyngbya cf. ectocarpi LEGE 11479]|uniref:4'-phosphopantetheinyl transferase superfamily protein n=1 Tax=Leptolyngbya cf. ectocarpi LEGE 11479 TaxID=1828722 RepID=A0A928ZVQ2_LEPEC|nr:4'-phosphopantetheinyl transferase superfamily protein [Leptolyngbya ectocarpi]MBE9068235.1 4'-phosphopantetheinyl transferase superfamily protein [Leptolyngbya cf. ectocarpi LEGE 11479]
MAQPTNAKHCLEQGAWSPATADCHTTLDTTTLDLWRISLDQPVSVDVLATDEQARLQRYRFAIDQRKFAVARTSLRQILARYSQQDPADLVFDYGVYGKPCLRDYPLQFNLSHSGEYALCGVARQVVGVDIEQLRSMDRLDGLIKRCLSPSEQQAIAAVESSQRSKAFLEYWTCKEAYLKATGQGISESLAAIEVDLSTEPKLNVPGQPWQLKGFIPCDGYTAAAVMPLDITQIRFWTYGA